MARMRRALRLLALAAWCLACRASVNGLKGIACTPHGCVFTNDKSQEVCWYDLASGDVYRLPGEYEGPHQVSMSPAGDILVADWLAGRVVRIIKSTAPDDDDDGDDGGGDDDDLTSSSDDNSNIIKKQQHQQRRRQQ